MNKTFREEIVEIGQWWCSHTKSRTKRTPWFDFLARLVRRFESLAEARRSLCFTVTYGPSRNALFNVVIGFARELKK